MSRWSHREQFDGSGNIIGDVDHIINELLGKAVHPFLDHCIPLVLGVVRPPREFPVHRGAIVQDVYIGREVNDLLAIVFIGLGDLDGIEPSQNIEFRDDDTGETVHPCYRGKCKAGGE